MYFLQLCLSSAVKKTCKLGELSEFSVRVVSFCVYSLVVSVSGLHTALMHHTADPMVENPPHRPV